MRRFLQGLFSRPKEPADILLNHLDKLGGSEARYVDVSDEQAQPRMNVAIYQGCPTVGAITGFTIGLSHFHPPGGAHRELTISMRGSDDAWALACGCVAFQLRESSPFECGHTVDFKERIAKSSEMSAFLIVHPRHIHAKDALVDLGVRRVEIVELLPIYQKEMAWLRAGGNVKTLLEALPTAVGMDPRRTVFGGCA